MLSGGETSGDSTRKSHPRTSESVDSQGPTTGCDLRAQHVISAEQGFRSPAEARRAIGGYEAVEKIRKGPLRWLPKGDVAGEVLLIRQPFGLKAP
jgi:hypothetical protein